MPFIFDLILKLLPKDEKLFMTDDNAIMNLLEKSKIEKKNSIKPELQKKNSGENNKPSQIMRMPTMTKVI
jgi:hypothetical protein